MTGKSAVVFIVSAMVGIANLSADEIVLLQIYGNGVHAFNQGDLSGAHAAFTAAIKGGSVDPRPYYFRGLTFLRLGRDDEAKADFQKGAEYEAVDSANVALVSRSLERIQGRSRQSLEQFRTVVRAAAVQRKEAEDRVIRQELAAEEMKVRRLVRPTELPSNPDVHPASGYAEKPAQDENPFAQPLPPSSMGDRGGAIAPKAAMPAETGNAPSDNPFEITPARPARPATSSDENPFGASPTVPTPKTSAPSMPGDLGAGGSAGAAPGAISSLFNAFVQGMPGDEPAAAAAPPSFEMPGMLRGILGGGPTDAPPANMAPTPAPVIPTAPAKDGDPFAETPAQTAPTPMQQAPPTLLPPQQTPPTPPKPADDADPFK